MTYIPFFLFLILAVAIVITEAMWLGRRGWTTSGKAWGFVLATDAIGFTIGFSISFAIVVVMFMMVMGPAGRGGTSSDASYAVLTGISLIFPPVVLMFTKRIFMLFFSMPGGKAAWIYSLVTGFLAAAIVVIPPFVVFYLLTKIA